MDKQNKQNNKPVFTCSACGPFAKTEERIQKLKETGDSQYIYQKEVDKTCFQHDMVYGDFKDLTRRTAADKALQDKAFNIAKNAKYNRYQRGLALVVYSLFDKKTAVFTVKNEIMQNQELAEELHKPIIKKFEKWKIHSSFIDNICGADIVEMQLLTKFNKWILFLRCVIDVNSKYAWLIPLEAKKSIAITNAFQIIFGESGPKPNKILTDKGRKF